MTSDETTANAKLTELEHSKDPTTEGHLTTNQGVPIADNQNSLKAGSRGPTLMEDFIFREKITHFDHERIPERIVHARGSAAHGYFQVYEPLPELTMASFLQDPSRQTPVFVRFSTVVGFRGSADTVRDVRGFATKFYTDDGIFDLVGNNMPVFFIQDAIKFPDLVHSIKPEPHNEMPQAAAAHDNFWDFVSLMPESLHMIMWVMSDRAIPRSYRMMEGFGVHTFRLVNADGRSRFVKFHWKPVLGMQSRVFDEAQTLGGVDPDADRRDLWQAIEAGHFPEYELGLQIVEESDADKFEFDLLDPTKIIPEALVPVRRVGKMVLNRNPDNFFAETEQVAFHPGHIVPGIDFTNDPLLQGRLFSYIDTQLIRLGGPNFAEIPINRPLNEVRNNQRDGYMRQTINRGRINYEPNSLGGGGPMQAGGDMRGFHSYAEKLEGHKVRERSDSFGDHFTQATLFWQSQTEVEQKHIVDAFHFELGKVEHMHVRQRLVELLVNVDRSLAERVARGIGVKDFSGDLSYLSESTAPRPNERRGAAAPGSDPALSIERSSRRDTIQSRMVAVLAADGVDAAALLQVRGALEAGGAMVEVVAPHLGPLDGGGEIEATKSFLTTGSVVYDAVLVAGGRSSADTLRGNGRALQFVAQAYRHYKPLAALGEGVEVLRAARIPEAGAESGNGATGGGGSAQRGVVVGADGATVAREFTAAIARHRHWDRPGAEAV
jgi:catalase